VCGKILKMSIVNSDKKLTTPTGTSVPENQNIQKDSLEEPVFITGLLVFRKI